VVAVPSPSLGALVLTAYDQVRSIVGDIGVLIKAELARDGKRAGIAVVLLVLALSLVPVIGILLVITLAQVLVAVGLPPWAAYLIDAAIWLVIAVLLVLLGLRQFKHLSGPKRTAAAIRGTIAAIVHPEGDGGAEAEFGNRADTNPTAGGPSGQPAD
jgi:membrane protein implicated in regulation of membrane protease activity